MKNTNTVILLLMVVVGGSLFAQSPSRMSNDGKCPAGTEITDKYSCCPSCSDGKVTSLGKGPIDRNKSNYPPTICVCLDKSVKDAQDAQYVQDKVANDAKRAQDEKDAQVKADLYKACCSDCKSLADDHNKFYQKYNKYNPKNTFESCNQSCIESCSNLSPR